MAIMLLAHITVQGQDKKTIDKELKLGDRAPVYISYYGNMAVYPGIRAGFSRNIFLIEKTIEKKKKIKL